MKIILANYRYYISGGPEVYMFNVKRLLEEAGHTVIPFSVRSPLNVETPYAVYFPHGKSESGDAYFGNVKKSPQNIARLLSCAFYNREAYKNLRQLIRDEKPDVVYVLQQINALSPSVFKAAHDEGIRVVHRLSDFNIMCPRSDFLCEGEVCTACIGGDYSKASKKRCCHGSRITTEIRIASMKYHRARRLFDCIDSFVCPTVFTAELLKESGIASERINVIPTFVDEYSSNSSVEGDRAPYALYLGRISQEKGVDLLVKSVLDRPNITLKITGRIDSEYSRSVVQMVQDAGVSDRVEFVGFVEGAEKDSLIDGATCVVCPSTWYENMPNTILEAFAHGKPVVVFDVGCMSEIVENGVNGAVVPLFDEFKLGETVERFVLDSSYARRIGGNGRRVAKELYSESKHLDSLIKVLNPDESQGVS